MNSTRPYFLWDYDLTEADVRRILDSGGELDKQWLISRILTSAKFEDVWKYTSLSDVRSMMPILKIKKPIRQAWERALSIWQ